MIENITINPWLIFLADNMTVLLCAVNVVIYGLLIGAIYCYSWRNYCQSNFWKWTALALLVLLLLSSLGLYYHLSLGGAYKPSALGWGMISLTFGALSIAYSVNTQGQIARDSKLQILYLLKMNQGIKHSNRLEQSTVVGFLTILFTVQCFGAGKPVKQKVLMEILRYLLLARFLHSLDLLNEDELDDSS